MNRIAHGRLTGIELITAERERQVAEEGYTPEHDDQHAKGELALAAACYAAPHRIFHFNEIGALSDPWPFEHLANKRPRDGQGITLAADDMPLDERIRLLVKAGAFLAAEIDRLDRLKAQQGRDA